MLKRKPGALKREGVRDFNLSRSIFFGQETEVSAKNPKKGEPCWLRKGVNPINFKKGGGYVC